MNKLFLSLLLIQLCNQPIFCQNTNKIDASDFIQILDIYFSKSNQKDFFYSNKFAVKLITTGRDSYTVVLASICYVNELPKDSLILIDMHNTAIFIISTSEIDISKRLSNNLHFITDENEIKKKAGSLLHREGVVYYPFIVIFTVNKENCFSKTRNVRYETFMPINDVPKKYWPITQPINAIVDELPRDKAYDIYGNLKEEWENKFENGKGKFRINTHK